MMNQFEVTDAAASLYDGGWRATDPEENWSEFYWECTAEPTEEGYIEWMEYDVPKIKYWLEKWEVEENEKA